MEPGGYSYAAAKHNEVTITFHRGGTQEITLAKSGKRLEFQFNGTAHADELAR